MTHLIDMSDLSVVDNVEQHWGDDAADGVGQHEDHHPLPTPQWYLCFTDQEMEKTDKLRSGNISAPQQDPGLKDFLPRFGAQNLPNNQIGHPNPNHLYGGSQAHGCSQSRLRYHKGNRRPHACLQYSTDRKRVKKDQTGSKVRFPSSKKILITAVYSKQFLLAM